MDVLLVLTLLNILFVFVFIVAPHDTAFSVVFRFWCWLQFLSLVVLLLVVVS